MIKRVTNIEDMHRCDELLTLLIQDEKKYDDTIDENFVVKEYFQNECNENNILLAYYENDDMAVELLFLDGGRENVYILYITVCVSFTDLPAGDILGYGFENPLFR